MPELPEVETIRRTLLPYCQNAVFDKIEVHDTRLRFPVDEIQLKRALKDRAILSIERRGKYLVFILQGDLALIVHLGMSGRLGIFDRKTPLEKHTHVIFGLLRKNDGHLEMFNMRFRDPRRFGLVELHHGDNWRDYHRFIHLGVEPLTGQFNVGYLNKKLNKSKRAVKNVLMDASVVVGVGNIYASEALFLSAVSPCVPAADLNSAQIECIVRSVKQILKNAIARGGTTLNDFRNGRGEPGFFQLSLNVYGREGEPCNQCTAPIRKIIMQNRSSYYCPNCQS